MFSEIVVFSLVAFSGLRQDQQLTLKRWRMLTMKFLDEMFATAWFAHQLVTEV
jgi:hypothetical protein